MFYDPSVMHIYVLLTCILRKESMPKRKDEIKILFVYSALGSFVRRDLEILEKCFHVKKMKVIMSPLTVLRLLKGILWADVVYAWFIKLNTFFTVLFCMVLRKKCIIVAGGYDVAYVPEINYGALFSPWRRIMAKFVLEHASKVLAVSGSNRNQIMRLARPKRLKLVYNGVDVGKFKPSGEKENLVITVGTVSDSTIKVKRLDTFVKAAAYLPDVRFILIGKYDGSIERLKKIAGSNVTFTGYISDESLLLHYYQKAKVYCQLSAHESFGVALAEAMSCCCVPVVTRRYALPEVVGDAGFYVPYNDPKATAEAIRKALKSDKGMKARERIKKYFSIKIRERMIINEILNLFA